MTLVPTDNYEDSVQQAVAREEARRKRVFRAFLALLFVPAAVGAYVLIQAPEETEKVANDVTPVVTQRVGEQIGSRITTEVVAKSGPMIQENVSRAITTRVEPRIATVAGQLRSEITSLQTTLEQTSAFVEAARPQLASVAEVPERVGSLQSLLDETRGSLNELSARQADVVRQFNSQSEIAQGLSARIERVQGQMSETASARQLAELRQSVGRDLEQLKEQANKNAQIVSSNRESISSLLRRVSALEEGLKKLDSRVARLEPRLQ